ncbi:hypothetical protein HAD_14382 [Hyphomonas adhaerens MHS-3]|uniref:Lipoprotein n=1 Tax=Hyphomonas adhaerens MHS-3 TaxID=1280949 RepID=A0A069E045_9PROT|nr:hypothetical protein [Hyphomonas adhaerens]KCZ82882.1 hypothetical protein HAD_14382 [Hyphomonas adhaerens MHS-3]
MRHLAVICVMLAASACQTLPGSLTAAARLERVNADLLAATSATLTLEKWCADYGLARPAQIVVEHTPASAKPPSDAQRQRLQVAPDTEVLYRNVKLKCGDRTLSEAENWYVPSRLTPVMNRTLTETHTPYGKVVRPLAPRRQTFEVQRSDWLDSQLSPNAAAATPVSLPSCDATVFSHGALVISGEGLPLAEVRENYKMDLVCPDKTGKTGF